MTMTIFELIEAGDADGLRELLERGPGAAAQTDEQGLSVVMRAAYRGLLDVVLAASPPLGPFDRIAAAADPNVFATAGFAQVTPLGTCRFAAADEVARVLLEHGADPTLVEVPA